MFEVGVSVRLRTADVEYLAMKTHELLRGMGTSELDTVYFSEVVGAVGDVSVALYLSRSNTGVLVVASACDDEGKCLAGPVRNTASVAKRVLRGIGNLVDVLRVEYVVKARVALSSTYRALVKKLRICGVELSEGGSYDAGWYLVGVYKGRYVLPMKRLDVVLTLVQERGGRLTSAQLVVSRHTEGVDEPSEGELVDCLKAVSQVIAHIAS